MQQDNFFFFLQNYRRRHSPSGASHFPGTKRVLLEAVICVEGPLAPAGGGVDVKPVGREHHEDEMGVELLLLLFHAAQIVIVWFHTCGSESVSLEDTKKNCRGAPKIC